MATCKVKCGHIRYMKHDHIVKTLTIQVIPTVVVGDVVTSVPATCQRISGMVWSGNIGKIKTDMSDANGNKEDEKTKSIAPITKS